jgi:hypothetical protein
MVAPPFPGPPRIRNRALGTVDVTEKDAVAPFTTE